MKMKKLFLLILFCFISLFGLAQSFTGVTASGTDTYAITVSGSSYFTNQSFEVRFTNPNTGAATLTVTANGVVQAAKAITTDGSTPVTAGQLSGAKWLIYNGTNFQIVNNSSGGGGTPGGSTTQVQFNLVGAFAGNSNFTINNGTGVVTFAQLPTIPVTPIASTDAVSKGYLDGLTLGPFSTTLNGYTLTSGGAGKLLLGDNTWLAAGTSGKVLVSNGTTWVNSTPTFPNASATTRKIIVSDGTNWVASTETYAVPGTSGNVLTSNGTNWTSASPISAGWNLTGATNLTGPATVIGSSTNTLAWDFGNLGTTDTDGAGGLYTNTTAATSGTFNVSQNHSPSLAFKAFAWKSNATAASESSVMRVSNDPRQYTTGILGVFAIKSNINAGGDKYIFDVQKAEVGGTAMNIYDSYTNSTTYDRLVISSDFLGVGSGFAIIKDRPGSTGALYIGNEQDATVNMRVNAGNRWRFSTNAESYSFVPSTDNVSDIGVAGANRVRNVYGGNISLGIAGNGILIKEGTNATMGTATANGTTEVTVSTTKVTANSRVFFNCQSGCGTSSAYYVSSRIGATSFGFKAIGADTGTVAWFILEPAP